MTVLPKRLLWTAIPLALAATMAGAAPAAAQHAAKPNILLIVGDDAGYGDLGPYGGGTTAACRRPISTSWPRKA